MCRHFEGDSQVDWMLTQFTMRFVLSAFALLSMIAAPSSAQQAWSPEPWIKDLSQAQQAFKTKYANIDWLEKDRGILLSSVFDRAAARLRLARSDADARAVFDRLTKSFNDGHVSITWPRRAEASTPVGQAQTPSKSVCAEMGFDASRSSVGIGPSLAGYRPLLDESPFPAGIVNVGQRKIGVIRIGVFEPSGSPQICADALSQLHIPQEQPCDDKCQDAILTWSYNKFTSALEDTVRALKSAGATSLLVDISGNGGGSEWAEAAARIMTPRQILSAKRGFVRGSHWASQWKELAAQLKTAASDASGPEQTRLLSWASAADSARVDAEQSCPPSGHCALVGQADYATGLVGRARSGEFNGKPWADFIFSIAQFPYHDGVWSGPLVVLVDNETWSAAEEFAALLQDNRAAVIIGSRTGGAGCGHTNGGTPTILTHSGATLEMPDCVRFRADGSNEVNGVIPDVLVGIRTNDSASFKARLVGSRLVEAVRRAERTYPKNGHSSRTY